MTARGSGQPAPSPADPALASARSDGSPARAPSPGRWARLAELGLLAAALLYALVFWLRLPGALPSEQDYLALRDHLQANAHPGDGLAVLPFWAERVKMFVHGLPVLALPDLAREPDAERYARLWVVAQPKLPHSDAQASLDALARRLDREGTVKTFGPLELWLFVPKPGRTATYDFVAHAQDSQVESAVPLLLEWREFDFLPRRCLISRAGRAVLHTVAVPMAHGLRLGVGPLSPGYGDVGIQATVGGKPLPPLQWVSGGPAFQTAEVTADLSGAGGPNDGGQDVTLTVLGRNVCFDAVAF